MADIVGEMRSAQALYERAGVDGAEGARMMKAGADEIERLRKIIDRAGALAMQDASAEHIRSVLAESQKGVELGDER